MLWPALSFAPVLLMALPPQSDDELEQQAQRVLVGEVLAVFQREVDVKDGKDLHFVAQVQSAQKGEGLVYVHFRQTASRPPGWSGPSGQSSALKVERGRVRLFLRKDADGSFWLLEPNGWAKAG